MSDKPNITGNINIPNPELVKRQGITPVGEIKLMDCHFLRDDLFEKWQKEDPTTADYRKHIKEYEDLEFELQRLWKFGENKLFHHWWKIPHCECPGMDNRDLCGSPQRIVMQECPVHGLKR